MGRAYSIHTADDGTLWTVTPTGDVAISEDGITWTTSLTPDKKNVDSTGIGYRISKFLTK